MLLVIASHQWKLTAANSTRLQLCLSKRNRHLPAEVTLFFYGYTGLGEIIRDRTVEVGRDLRRPSGLTDLPKPGSAKRSHWLAQGLIQLGLETPPPPPKTETAQPPWATSSRLSSWWRIFSSHVVGLSLVRCLCSSCHAPLGRAQLRPLQIFLINPAQLHPLQIFLINPGRLLLGAPKAISSPGWTSPAPSASAHGVSAPAPATLVARCWTPILTEGLKIGCHILDTC